MQQENSQGNKEVPTIGRRSAASRVLNQGSTERMAGGMMNNIFRDDASDEEGHASDIDASDFSLEDDLEGICVFGTLAECQQQKPDEDAQERTMERRRQIDWLMDVALEKFKLHPVTWYSAVATLDAILRDKLPYMDRGKYQLLASSCLRVASKYEESAPTVNTPTTPTCENKSGIDLPTLADYIHMVNSAFTRDELKIGESEVLNLLDLNFPRSSPLEELEKMTQAEGMDSALTRLAHFFLDLSMYGDLAGAPILTPAERATEAVRKSRQGMDKIRAEVHALRRHAECYSSLLKRHDHVLKETVKC